MDDAIKGTYTFFLPNSWWIYIASSETVEIIQEYANNLSSYYLDRLYMHNDIAGLLKDAYK